MTMDPPTTNRSRWAKRMVLGAEMLAALVFAAAFVLVATRGTMFSIHPSVMADKTKATSHHLKPGLVAPTGRVGSTLFLTTFSGRDSVVSSELGKPASPTWIVTSGSLFLHGGYGWSGVPDAGPASGTITGRTGSAVFRAVLRQRSFGDVSITVRVRPVMLVTTLRTPAKPWDGVTILLRYRSQYYLYAVNIARRDGLVAIKRKLPKGPANGGVYTTIAQGVAPARMGQWTTATVVAKNGPHGSVQIALWINGKLVLSAVDTSGHALTGAGTVGIRADNCEFYVSRLKISNWVP